ncbi:MAG: 7-cyano-7-deazaguanine synthase QueC [Candidatus Omnitrophota bacterium]
MKNKRAVVLLSGGLDSAVGLYFAVSKGFDCYCLIFDYGQRHKKEIECAKKLARGLKCPYTVLKIDLPWKGSSLLDKRMPVPGRAGCDKKPGGIPSTYVPGRNIIFLSYALSYAEAIGAGAIFIGAHSQDYSGYPDCRPEFYRSFGRVILTGTKAGVQGKALKVHIPLIRMNKARIIRLGVRLGVPFGSTRSCYNGGKSPCGICDSCRFRAKGFREAGIKDPALAK